MSIQSYKYAWLVYDLDIELFSSTTAQVKVKVGFLYSAAYAMTGPARFTISFLKLKNTARIILCWVIYDIYHVVIRLIKDVCNRAVCRPCLLFILMMIFSTSASVWCGCSCCCIGSTSWAWCRASMMSLSRHAMAKNGHACVTTVNARL